MKIITSEQFTLLTIKKKTMKLFISTLGCLMFLTSGYSQNSDFKKNEVSIGLISLIESPKNQEILFENSYYIIPISSFTYKRFITKKTAIRLTYYRPIDKSYNNTISVFTFSGKYKEQAFKIGYEYNFKQKTLTPYVALEIVYLKSTSLMESIGGVVGILGLDTEIKSIGLSPTIGINYKIYNNIFIGLESNLNILRTSEEKLSYVLTKESGVMETDEYFEYIFNPIIFLVKIKF